MAFTWHPAFETGNFRGVPKGTLMWQLWSAIEQRNQIAMIKQDNQVSPWVTPPIFPYPNSMSEFDWLQEAMSFVLYLGGGWVYDSVNCPMCVNEFWTQRNVCLLDYFPCGQVYNSYDLKHYRVTHDLIEDYHEITRDPRDTPYDYIPGARLLQVMDFDAFIDPVDFRRTPHSHNYEMLITQLYTFLSRMNCVCFEHYTRPNQPSNVDPFYNYTVRWGNALRGQTVSLIGYDLNTPSSLTIDADGFFPQDWQDPTQGWYIGSFDIRPFLTEPFPLSEV